MVIAYTKDTPRAYGISVDDCYIIVILRTLFPGSIQHLLGKGWEVGVIIALK